MKNLLRITVGIMGLILIPQLLYSQKYPKNFRRAKDKKVEITAELNMLKSSHHTQFTGGSMVVDYKALKYFSFGAGAEFSYCNYNINNGFDLSNLKFIPLFADARFSYPIGKTVVPYLRLSSGASFASYTRKEEFLPSKPVKFQEIDLYFLAAGGLSLKTKSGFNPFVEVGYKNYNMSFGKPNVNPQGLAFSWGIVF